MRYLNGGWYQGQIEYDGTAYTFQAKIYDEGSIYGIDGGRVSKLTIVRTGDSWTRAVYHYDRGLDVDDAPAGLLAAVLAVANSATKPATPA